MTKGIEWKIVNEWRGMMTQFDMPNLLVACAYLKFKDEDSIKALMLQDKSVFNKLLEQEIGRERNLPNSSIFIGQVSEVISKLPDGRYRETLKMVNEYMPKDLMISALDMMRLSGEITSNSLNELLVLLAGVQKGDSVLDATTGSAGILVEAIKYKPEVLIGQEINTDLAMFAAINLIVNDALHSEIFVGDIFEKAEYYGYGKFNRVIQVPPFGYRITRDLSNDDRFKFGPLSRSVGDWAFVSNALSALNPEGGRAVIVVPNGALFRGGPDKIIRQSILGFDFIESVISLPNGMFSNTMIPTAVLVLNTKKDERVKNHIQFIKVSEDEVEVVNRRERILPEELIEKIVTTFETKESIEGFSKVVSLSEIRNADLVVESYVVQDSYIFDGLAINADFNKLEEIETAKLSHVATLSRGFNNTRSTESELGKYQVIRISDITEDGINYGDLVKVTSDVKNVNDYKASKGDLLLSIRGTTNKVGLVDKEDDTLLFNANLIRIRTKNDYDSEWLKIYLESPMAKVLLERISRGTTIKQISLADLRNFPVPMLSLEEQQKAKKEYEKGIEEVKMELEKLHQKEYNIKRTFYQSLPIADAFEILPDNR
ncbi:N-6 DNA methylase [Lactococcus lactis]|uniref:N-6 DNA methylase n=1 Tax=Lactococcus lactis TaxID=1358 RepID=UPI001914D890|nr:N-6 DNA methylase [Lactococcus lactis]MBK5077396.1 N-6 DNA methylase [Lactococcus lactis]